MKQAPLVAHKTSWCDRILNQCFSWLKSHNQFILINNPVQSIIFSRVFYKKFWPPQTPGPLGPPGLRPTWSSWSSPPQTVLTTLSKVYSTVWSARQAQQSAISGSHFSVVPPTPQKTTPACPASMVLWWDLNPVFPLGKSLTLVWKSYEINDTLYTL